MHYLNHIVFPLLGGSYGDAVGRELMAATARLCDLCGFMCHDDGRQGLAQHYFIQGRLAQASGNRALGAYILGDMSTQAVMRGSHPVAGSQRTPNRRRSFTTTMVGHPSAVRIVPHP